MAWQIGVAQPQRPLIRVHRHQVIDPCGSCQTVRCCASAYVDSGHYHGLGNRIHMFQRALTVTQIPIGITLIDLIRHLQRSNTQ
ncbi:hypothetical protein D3C80_1802430 [compost metagenome]